MRAPVNLEPGEPFDLAPADELEATLDEAGVGTWTLNSAGQVRLSATCAALLGTGQRDFQSIEALQSFVHPDDRDIRAGALADALSRGGRYEVDYRAIRQNGETIWLRSCGTVKADASGQPYRLRGVLFSIDAQKRAEKDLTEREAHLRSIMASIPEGIVVIDAGGRIRSFSKTAERLFGYREKDVIDRNVSLLMPEPDRSRHDGYIRRYEETGKARIIGTGRVVTGQRRDGSTFPMQLAIGEVKSGDRTFYTGFVSDLSERHATLARLQELQSELAHLSRLTAMGEMASTLAHELNQPLAAISNYMKGSRRLLTASSSPVAPKALEGLDKAAEQAVRAGQIIRRLRDFVSRGETEKRVESVPKLIDEAGALALVGSRERGVITRFQIDPAVRFVSVDRVQIQQVLVNLLRNAMDSMEGVERRELHVEAAPAPDGMVAITVADTGPGVSPDIADRLFQPFVTTKKTGMGIGLSISRTIVEAHGGLLEMVASTLGGATFRLTLPSGDGH